MSAVNVHIFSHFHTLWVGLIAHKLPHHPGRALLVGQTFHIKIYIYYLWSGKKRKLSAIGLAFFLLDQMAHDIWIHLDPLQTAEDLKFCWMGWRKQVAFPHNVPKIILHVQTHLCWYHVIRYMCYMLNMWPVSMLLLHLSLKLVLVWLLKIVR